MSALTLEALQEQINQLKADIAELKGHKQVAKKKAGIGDEFEVAGLKWKILDITAAGYVCLAEKLAENMVFDIECNNWAGSSLRKYLNTTFFEKLAQAIGDENIIPFTRDLLSLDGLDEYGTCEDKVSLISFDEYRKYRKLIPNADYHWWTITPDTTKGNGNSKWIAIVCSSGDINFGSCGLRDGVRPFCIFSSSIFESPETMNGDE